MTIDQKTIVETLTAKLASAIDSGAVLDPIGAIRFVKESAAVSFPDLEFGDCLVNRQGLDWHVEISCQPRQRAVEFSVTLEEES